MTRMVLPGERERVGDAAQVVPQQGDAGRLEGHVGAAAHGDAEVGLGQCGRIVEPVSHHGHLATLRLVPPHDVELALGDYLRLDARRCRPAARRRRPCRAGRR